MGAIEWQGNLLATAGAWCDIGDLRAELMRVDPQAFASSDGGTCKRPKRAWVLAISDRSCFRIGHDCLASVILVDLMPDAAKREAEQLLRWAHAARRNQDRPPPAGRGAGEKVETEDE
jgi:hypothetical protein